VAPPPHRFPFGALLAPTPPVRPASGPAAFVVGVHAGAVHARWIGPDGRERCRALPVAAEPHAFWRGEDAAAIVRGIAAGVPPEMGRLEPAPEPFDGATGRALDTYVLGPLGLGRDRCFVTDVHDAYLMPSAQRAALGRYDALRAASALPPASLPVRPRVLSVGAARARALREAFRASGAPLLVTLGDEPARALLGARAPRLSHDRYGEPERLDLDGRRIVLLRLCHPRHPGRLGSLSPDWELTHVRWVRHIEALGGLAALVPAAEVARAAAGASPSLVPAHAT
jgi:hypothetical protein